jgi:hypothetical protein
MNVHQWAVKWGVPHEAFTELMVSVFGHIPVEAQPTVKRSEAAVQQAVKIKASHQGRRMFRNNVGVLPREDGVPIRFGLANDSKAMNKNLKSSDLIGVSPIQITQDMVGTVIGQFTSLEVKKPGWTYNPNDEHQAAQQKWHELVIRFGGDSRFITHEDQL